MVSSFERQVVHAVHTALSALGLGFATIRGLLSTYALPFLPYPLCTLLWAPRPGSTSSIDARWLTTALRSSGTLPTGHVVSVSGEDLADNRGFVGVMNVLVIEYSADAPQSAPKSLILKMTPNTIEGRRFCMTTGSYREALYYNSSYYGNVGDINPVVHYAHGSSLFGELLMVMENVKLRDGCTPVNFCYGNQVWGVPNPVTPKVDAVDMMRSVYGRTAVMHARYWNDPSLLASPWLKCANLYRGQGRLKWELAVDFIKSSWARAKTGLADGSIECNVSDRVIDLIDRTFANTSWDKLQSILQDRSIPYTLTHGDFHASNMFCFNKKGRKDYPIVMFDWSETGVWEGTADLCQTVISDAPRELIKNSLEDLVRHYWETLGKNGVNLNEYTWDICWQRFRTAGLERWLMMFPVMAGWPGMPGVLIQFLHDQIECFLDHVAVEDYEYTISAVVFMMENK